MEYIAGLLGAICFFLLLILVKVDDIAKRLRQQFPTEKERDHQWALDDPAGHWEAHKND